MVPTNFVFHEVMLTVDIEVVFEVLFIVLVLGSKPLESNFSALILSIKAILAPVLERAKAVIPPTNPLPTIAMSILSAKIP